MNRDECILYSGAAGGAEAEFGAAAERYRICLLYTSDAADE